MVSPCEEKDRDMSSESTEFCRDRKVSGTARKAPPRSPFLEATGLDTLWGLVGRLSLLSKGTSVLSSGRVLPACRCETQLVDNGSTARVFVGLTASSWGEMGDCDRCCWESVVISGTLVLLLTSVVSMVMVGL